MNRIGILLLFLPFPFPLFAVNSQHVDLLVTFGSFTFVIALIIIFSWLLKRMKVFGTTSSVHDGMMSIVKQLPVGTKERLAVIQVGKEQFLIGITAQNINLLNKLDVPLEKTKSTTISFSEHINQLMKKNVKN